jgi:DNA-binding LacI/PurR family transcriptional regulator
VTGFGDFSIAQMTLPALTSVRFPWEEISQDEIEMQVEPINGNKLQEMNVHMPVSLVIRDSAALCRESSRAYQGK